MEYRKVGRGGAGNYYSKKDVEDAAKKAALERDLEAQKQSLAQNASSPAIQPKYSSSGRGGAGNVTETVNLAPTASDPADAGNVPHTKNASTPGHYGRGGAGNFAGPEVVDSQPQERELQDMAHRDIYAEAEAGLQEPARAHLGGQKKGADV